jgi:hypothetical protein
VGKNQVYAANGSSIFYFDREDNSLNSVSKYTGLNDVRVSATGYNASQDVFILGYETGNIDIIKGNKITNANDIVRNNITGSKRINHIMSHNEYMYLSGEYGVVLYNLSKNEVKESYLTLAPNSTVNPVYASSLTSDKDSIFLATSKGVMAASTNQSVNLLAFTSWYTFQASDSIDNANVVSVCAHGGVMYAAVLYQGIYYYNGSKWRKTSIPMTGGGIIRSLTKSGNGILACVDSTVYKITSPSSWKVLYHKDEVIPAEAGYDSENTLWITSLAAGLVRVKDGSTYSVYPNGPLTNKVFRFGYYNNNLVELSGGYNSLAQKTYYGDWFSTFENNSTWTTARFDYYYSIPASFQDFICATYNSRNSVLYNSRYGNGLIGINPDKTVKIYDNGNSPLPASGAGVLVGETAVDKDGNLWVPNNASSYLYKLSSQGDWTSYPVTSYGIGVTIDDYDNKWIKLGGPSATGLVIYNEKTGSVRAITNAPGQGHLPDKKVNCITKDKKGNIIVGTDQGIAVCYDPYSTLHNGVDLVMPIFEGFPLLYERNVLSIEVDGGNRKWVGTNDGLWLFDEDLSKVLLYFDTENSPLLSDFIMDIKIQELSGEVFFATQEGIASFRGTATEGAEKYSDVKVFPNPVKPGYRGLVAISGLVTDAVVKITDVNGNLVYETKAEGGTAIWNVKDYNGTRAATGVYLIFCATAEGTEKFVSKISVIE